MKARGKNINIPSPHRDSSLREPVPIVLYFCHVDGLRGRGEQSEVPTLMCELVSASERRLRAIKLVVGGRLRSTGMRARGLVCFLQVDDIVEFYFVDVVLIPIRSLEVGIVDLIGGRRGFVCTRLDQREMS